MQFKANSVADFRGAERAQVHVMDSGMSVGAMTLLLHPSASGHTWYAPRLSTKLGRLCTQASCSQGSYRTAVIANSRNRSPVWFYCLTSVALCWKYRNLYRSSTPELVPNMVISSFQRFQSEEIHVLPTVAFALVKPDGSSEVRRVGLKLLQHMRRMCCENLSAEERQQIAAMAGSLLQVTAKLKGPWVLRVRLRLSWLMYLRLLPWIKGLHCRVQERDSSLYLKQWRFFLVAKRPFKTLLRLLGGRGRHF